MFKYIKFDKVTDDVTTYEFRGGGDNVIVNHFDVNVVSINSNDESEIDALIQSQDEKINCELITKEMFKALVKDIAQLNRIRTIVKERISSRYSIADEIAMIKRDESDIKKIEYEVYVQECILVGQNLKSLIGY